MNECIVRYYNDETIAIALHKYNTYEINFMKVHKTQICREPQICPLRQRGSQLSILNKTLH